MSAVVSSYTDTSAFSVGLVNWNTVLSGTGIPGAGATTIPEGLEPSTTVVNGDTFVSLVPAETADPSVTDTVDLSVSLVDWYTAIPSFTDLGEFNTGTEGLEPSTTVVNGDTIVSLVSAATADPSATFGTETLTPVTTVSDGSTIIDYQGTATATVRATGYITTYLPTVGGTQGLELSTTTNDVGDTFVSYIPAATSGAAEYGSDAPNSYATSSAGSEPVYSILPIGGPYGPDNGTVTPNPYASGASGNAAASAPAQFEGGAAAVSSQGLTAVVGLLGLVAVALI